MKKLKLIKKEFRKIVLRIFFNLKKGNDIYNI
jgi:hypothetical protein